MKLGRASLNEPVFKGKARSVEELIASIKDGRFTLDGSHLVVKGNFSLNNNQLTSLIGCPQVIKGNFSCWHNLLKTLEGGPREVDGNYNCSYNRLVSLNGAPRHIKGDFWCDDNPLASLEGGPELVDGSYDCSRTELTSLVGCARIVKGNLYAGNKYLTSLEGCPRFVGKKAFFQFCKNLTSIKNIESYLPEARGIFLQGTPISGPLLGLLRVKGLGRVELGDHKLMSILNKYLPDGNLLACAMELVEAGYEEQARL
jgi:hypothetical protein